MVTPVINCSYCKKKKKKKIKQNKTVSGPIMTTNWWKLPTLHFQRKPLNRAKLYCYRSVQYVHSQIGKCQSVWLVTSLQAEASNFGSSFTCSLSFSGSRSSVWHTKAPINFCLLRVDSWSLRLSQVEILENLPDLYLR